MSSQNKALVILSNDPLGTGGGAFGQRSILQAICDIYTGSVDIIVADEKNKGLGDVFNLDTIYTAKSRGLFEIARGLLHGVMDRYVLVAKKIIKSNPGMYTCIFANSCWVGGSLAAFLNKNKIPLVTIHHNYEPEYFRDNSKGIKRFILVNMTERLGRIAYKRSTINTFVSKQDLDIFKKRYGDTNAICITLGVFEFQNVQPPSESMRGDASALTFVITGTLCAQQGVDGIQYFFDSLYQNLPSTSHIIIAGKNPTKEVQNLCDKFPNVTLVPNPTDMNSVISGADVYICPTRLGGGVKLRVMDGLRLGLPVITHSCSSRGYDLFWGSPAFEVFNTPEEFAMSVRRIVQSYENNALNKRATFDLYIDVFSYKSGKKRLQDALIKAGLL